MAQNFPGPYGVEIEYIVDGVTHNHEVNCSVQGSPAAGVDMTTLTVDTKDGVGANLAINVSDYVDEMRKNYNVAVQFSQYTLWKYDALSTARNFISSEALGVLGTNVSPTVPAQQMTQTYRTAEGGIMRIVLLEHVYDSQGQSALATNTQDGIQTMKNIIVADSNWILARDTSYPIAPLGLSFGENERVWRKRYRS